MHVPTEVRIIEAEVIHFVQKEALIHVSQSAIWFEQGSQNSELELKVKELLMQLKQNVEELQ